MSNSRFTRRGRGACERRVANIARTVVTVVMLFLFLSPATARVGVTASDPCFGTYKYNAAVASRTSGGILIPAVIGKRAYICGGFLVTSTPSLVGLTEGTGAADCSGGTQATVIPSASYTGNGGINLGNGSSMYAWNSTAGQNICVTFTTTNGPLVTVYVMYVYAP